MVLDNLWNIIKTTWKPLFILSISFTGILFSYIPNKSLYDWSDVHLLLSFLLLLTNYIVFFISILWSFAKSFSFVNGFNIKYNFKRCFIPFLFYLAFVFFIASCFFGNIHKWIYMAITALHISSELINTLTWTISSLVVLIIGCIILPLQYAFTHYIINSKVKLINILKTEYWIGLHYWGYLFLSNLITTLIIAVFSIVVAVPLAIIIFADIYNSYGILIGDSNKTPSYFYMLLIVTSMVCSIIIFSISLWHLYTNCYICSSINIQHAQKSNYQKTRN